MQVMAVVFMGAFLAYKGYINNDNQKVYIQQLNVLALKS
jgi:hypothetical protein